METINLVVEPETVPSGFDAFNFHPQLKAALAHLNFTVPTPIQAQSIPVALAGRDLIGLAQTGTGKTAAYLLPMIHHILSHPKPKGAPRALVLTPTRELSEQVASVVNSLGEKAKVSCVTVYGGTSMTRQISELHRGIDIVVACPGRLLDHMGRRTVNLSRIEFLVLDEADRMFDMGFLPSIREILVKLPRNQQRMLFSATMPSSIRQLTAEVLRDPETVQIGDGKANRLVEHVSYVVPSNMKREAVLRLVDEDATDTILIFTRTKDAAQGLSDVLNVKGYSVAALHGDMSQHDRNAALQGFRDGQHRILVATDVAARGIDVTGIGRVINYDMPDSVESYIHRVGRTGRAAATGKAISIITPTDAAITRQIEGAGCKMTRSSLEGITSRELEKFVDLAAHLKTRSPRGRPSGGGFGGGSRGRR
jgi:ATP-dependent RNA helicase RhlE